MGCNIHYGNDLSLIFRLTPVKALAVATLVACGAHDDNFLADNE